VIYVGERPVLSDKLKKIVGPKNVTDNEIIMEAYTASTFRPQAREGLVVYTDREKPKKPSFIVTAGSTEEVQEVVRLANQYKVPIIPMGALTGQYAEAVPLEGGIMLDLCRMKKIEIDEELLTVTLEPGVTFAQAYRELATKGYWIVNQSLPASIPIMGATTQAGAHMPFDKYAEYPWSYHSNLTIGLEVVLPTGELLVTGSAALPGARHQHARAYGPDVGSLFLGAQGTLGIITKQVLPVYRIPKARHIVTGLFKIENFKGYVKAFKRIMDDNFEGAIWVEKAWGWYDAKAEEWQLYVILYGSKEMVNSYSEFSEKTILEEGGKIRAGFSPMLEPEADWSGGFGKFYEEFIFWRPRANSIVIPAPGINICGVGGATSFSILPELHDAALRTLLKNGITKSRFHTGIFTGGPTTASVTYYYAYDQNDAEEAKRAKAIREEWQKVSSEIIGKKRPELGFAAYRPSPSTARELMPKLGEYYNFLVKLKRTIDPNRIMNPGKLMDQEPY
jgi:FAD/FMN-containing dehydrogenase